MMRKILLLPFLFFSLIAQAQYSETFSTPNKGYLPNFVDDFTGVGWTLSAWAHQPPADFGRDNTDYFRTSTGGVLEGKNFDQEVCWTSPSLTVQATGNISFTADITWAQFDDNQSNPLEFINVEYQINGGAWVRHPNVIGANGDAAYTVRYITGGGNQSGTATTNFASIGVTAGQTVVVRFCASMNTNAEVVTLDNVNVTGVGSGCAAPNLSVVVSQVGCSNPNSGAIDLSVSAGTPGYTYAWSNGQTTQDLTNRPVGTYTVTVTDAASCTATISATITNAPALSLSTLVLDASCAGNSDGEIDLTVSGGVPGYTYDWSHNGPQNPDIDPQDLVGVGAGTYTVTVTDATGCSATKSATVNVQPSGAYLEQFNTPNKGYLPNFVDDFAGVNWTLSNWPHQPPVAFGRDFNDYFQTVGGVLTAFDLDSEVCWESPLIALGSGTMFSVDLSWNEFDPEDYIKVLYSIDGGSYVQIPNVAGGGAATIQYTTLGNSGAMTVSKTGLSGSTIQIQICAVSNSDPETITIDNVSVPGSNPYCPAPEPSLSPINVSCNGAANGSITNTVTDGQPPYSYIWSNGATTQNLSNIGPGTYTVTVTDANMQTGTASTNITQPSAISLSTTQVNLLCNGAATGSIDLSVSGGVPGYTYNWGGGITTQDRSNLAAGTYTVTVTDANNCTKTISATITEPSEGMTLSVTQVNVLCNGAATGSIDLSVSGGVPGYTYSWGGGITTQDRSNLTAGTYTVTVTDANNCTKTISATITEPTALSLSTTQVNVLCNGNATGAIDLTPIGGTPGYTYNWGGGITLQDRTNLAAGTYTVTVTDANNCTKTISATITEPTALSLSTTQVNVLCNGNATGSIDLTPSGGTPGYTYNWGGGITTQDRSNLAAGTYTVTVTDANNCTKTISATITEPSEGMTLSTTHVNVLCNGAATGSIDLSVSGGTPGYSYNWGGGVTTQDRSNLTAGTYTVTVTDANNCTKTISATITEPTALSLSTTQVNVLCNGNATGSIDLTPSGGTPGYTYNWGGGITLQDRTNLAAGTYTVTVTDANNCTKTISATITEPTALSLSTTQVNVLCNGNATGSIDLTPSGGTPGYTYNWGGGITTQDRSNLAAGTYTVTVTDANNCTKTISATITEPTVLSLSTTQVNVLCNGNATGSIDLSVSGGVPGYTYNWGGGITTQDRTNLPAGTYTVTVTDANNCSKTISATISETTDLSLSTTQVNVLCNGNATGSIDLTPSGGTPGYTYNWGGGITLQDRTNLAAGTYTVTVTDANNCTKTISATITEPTALSLSTTQVNVLCNGNASGSIDLTPSGGVPGYTYNWGGGITTQDRANLPAGTYTVTVTDANNCTKTISATISQPTALNLSSTVVQPSNCFVADGSIDLTVSGGTPGYTYNWGGGITTQDRLNLVENTYTVTVTDANGCTATHSRTLDYIDIVKPSISCPNNTTVSADASCSSAIGSFSPTALSDNCTANPTVVQSPASSTIINGANPVRTVTLTATDEAGNTESCSFTVSLIDLIPPSISCPANQNINANTSCTGSLGTWNPASLSDNCTANPGVVQSPASSTVLSGHNDFRIVTLTATDGSGNTASCTFTVTLKDVTQPNISCPANVTVNANASCNGTIGSFAPTVLNDNCTANPSVTQSPAAGTVLSGHNAASTVTLTATDGAGNTRTCTLTVTLKDVSPPTVVCQNYVAILDASGNASIVPANVYQSGNDNCGTVNLQSVTPNTFNCSNIGANLVTLTVNDGNGNTASCNATVIVRDVTPPVALCKTAIINADLGTNGTVLVSAALINNGSTDNCNFSLTLTPNLFNCSHIGLNTVTLRVTDAGGNSATCTARVQVRDLVKPSAKCKNPTIFLDNAGNATLSVAQVDNGSSDACGLASLAISQTHFTCAELAGSPWPVTLNMTDVNGNSASCLGYVTVKDAIAPDAVCEDVTVELGPSGYVVVYGSDLADGSVDNCSVWSYSPIAKVYTTANLGNNNLLIAVRDWSNNIATCTSIVTVLPYTPPGNHEFQQSGSGTAVANPWGFDFAVYPNPTSGSAVLAFELPAEQAFSLRLFDLAGRLVMSHEDIGVEGENILPLRLTGLSPGLYLLDVQTAQQKAQKRLLIQE